jgi:hypothetical protein
MENTVIKPNTIDREALAKDLEGLKSEGLEILSKHARQLAGAATLATPEEPVTILSPVCPDFPESPGQLLGTGVSELAQQHLVARSSLFEVLDSHGVPHRHVVAVADSEAAHDIQIETYGDGSVELFLERCAASALALEKLIDGEERGARQLPSESTTFYGHFGLDEFDELEKAFLELLEDTLARPDPDVDTDVSSPEGQLLAHGRKLRKQLGIIVSQRRESHRQGFGSRGADLAAMRALELRAIAQNLTLGALIAARETHPIVIVHNMHVRDTINQRTKFVLPSQPTADVPVARLL